MVAAAVGGALRRAVVRRRGRTLRLDEHTRMITVQQSTSVHYHIIVRFRRVDITTAAAAADAIENHVTFSGTRRLFRFDKHLPRRLGRRAVVAAAAATAVLAVVTFVVMMMMMVLMMTSTVATSRTAPTMTATAAAAAAAVTMRRLVT